MLEQIPTRPRDVKPGDKVLVSYVDPATFEAKSRQVTVATIGTSGEGLPRYRWTDTAGETYYVGARDDLIVVRKSEHRQVVAPPQDDPPPAGSHKAAQGFHPIGSEPCCAFPAAAERDAAALDEIAADARGRWAANPHHFGVVEILSDLQTILARTGR